VAHTSNQTSALSDSGHPAKKQFHQFILLGPEWLPKGVGEALQNDCVPSRWVALGHAGCEHVFITNDLPVPFRATLPNAAVKYRLGQKELLFTGGSVGQLPHPKVY
jgi:hypothetical protein